MVSFIINCQRNQGLQCGINLPRSSLDQSINRQISQQICHEISREISLMITRETNQEISLMISRETNQETNIRLNRGSTRESAEERFNQTGI